MRISRNAALIELAAIAVILLILALLAARPAQGKAAGSPYWHVYADLVAYPELQAALNRLAIEHPKDKTEGSYDHAAGYDVKVQQHVDAVREKFRDWNDAQKKAGY